MLAKAVAVIRSQALGALALFVALGGTSYAVATGSIDSREIKNNTVRGKDIRNRTINDRDVKRNGLGGTNIKESRLGKVPSAASADRAGSASNADSVGGVSASALRPRCPGGTTLVAASCLEVTSRAAKNWPEARGVCTASRRRLATVSELHTFRLRPGRFLGSDGEWTSDTADSGGAETRRAIVYSDGDGDASISTLHPFRCVAEAVQ